VKIDISDDNYHGYKILEALVLLQFFKKMRKFLNRIMALHPIPQKVKEVVIILLAWLTAGALVCITYQKFKILFHK
jgi:hypothetical protein